MEEEDEDWGDEAEWDEAMYGDENDNYNEEL